MDICDLIGDVDKRVLFAAAGRHGDPQVLYGGIHRLSAGAVARRVKDHWTLHVLIAGAARCGRGRRARSLGPGDAYLYQPYEDRQLVATTATTGEPCVWMWVGFHSAGLRDELATAGIRGGALASAAWSQPLIDGCTAILRELDAPGVRSGLVLSAHLQLVLTAIIRTTHAHAGAVAAPCRHEAVQTALQMIDNSHGRAMSVAELARGVGLERSYFSRLFRRQTGRTVREVLQEARLHRARELLHHSTCSMTQIAQLSGFDNYFSFYRFFSQATGMSPSAFRSRSDE
ncbi:MAG: helix-turn-helix transcriptional regulator [Planctomycetota bacterium]